MPNSGYLTENVLTPEQIADGYTLREDDHNIFACKKGFIKLIFGISAKSDIIRQAVENLRKEVKKQ